MPKPVAITKEMIEDAAFAMIREEGLQALSARNIANKLGCSTGPIYKTYANMDDLKGGVLQKLMAFMMQNILDYRKTGCGFLDSGLGYIHFARTEKVLFHLFCLESRNRNAVHAGIGNEEIRVLMERELCSLALTEGQRDRIFLQTMIFTYGLAVLCYLGHLEQDEDETAAMLEKTFDSYVRQELEETK